jgi:hypothetical protein
MKQNEKIISSISFPLVHSLWALNFSSKYYEQVHQAEISVMRALIEVLKNHRHAAACIFRKKSAGN